MQFMRPEYHSPKLELVVYFMYFNCSTSCLPEVMLCSILQDASTLELITILQISDILETAPRKRTLKKLRTF